MEPNDFETCHGFFSFSKRQLIRPMPVSDGWMRGARANLGRLYPSPNKKKLRRAITALERKLVIDTNQPRAVSLYLRTVGTTNPLHRRF